MNLEEDDKHFIYDRNCLTLCENFHSTNAMLHVNPILHQASDLLKGIAVICLEKMLDYLVILSPTKYVSLHVCIFLVFTDPVLN